MISKLIVSGLAGISGGFAIAALYVGDLHSAAIGFTVYIIANTIRTAQADYYGGE